MCKKSLAYETPNKIIMRFYLNLMLKCKNLGCSKIIKHEDYFNHIFNECSYYDNVLRSNLKYCKKCEEFYEINPEDNATKHLCVNSTFTKEYKDFKY